MTRDAIVPTADPFDLSGKVSVVIGASAGGLGEHIARGLAGRGARLVVSERPGPRSGLAEPSMMIFPYGVLVDKGGPVHRRGPGPVDANYGQITRTLHHQTDGLGYVILDARLADVPNHKTAIRTDQPLRAETIGNWPTSSESTGKISARRSTSTMPTAATAPTTRPGPTAWPPRVSGRRSRTGRCPSTGGWGSRRPPSRTRRTGHDQADSIHGKVGEGQR